MLVFVPLSYAEHTSDVKTKHLEGMVSPNQVTDVTDKSAYSRSYGKSTYQFVSVQGQCIKIGVKSTGSFGRGNTTPGIQYNKACKGVFSDNFDFVTPDMPHEVVSVKLDGQLFADSNASCAYGGRCSSIFLNNLVDDSSISNQSGKVYRGTRWAHRIVTKGTKNGYYVIENDIRFNSRDKIIEITTYLTPQKNFKIGLISRSVDSDAKIVTGDDNATYNNLGYSVVNSKYLVFSETWISKAVMGMYTGEELNTGAGISSSWSQDPDTYLARKNDKNGDWTIGLAKKFTNLVRNRTYTFRYSYVFGDSAYGAVSNAINTGAAGGKPGKVPGCTGKCTVVDVGPIGPTLTRVPPTSTPLPTSTPPPFDSGNLELCNSNCNFSSGNMSGWSQSGGSFDVNSKFVRSSPYAVNGTNATSAEFYRSFSVSAYATYIDQSGGQVNVNAYIDPGNSENGALNVYFLNNSGNELSRWESGWKSNPREEWTQVSQSLNVPVGTRSIMIKFKAKRSGGSYTDMNVDDVSVIARFRSNP
jgi:hypothetical protein